MGSRSRFNKQPHTAPRKRFCVRCHDQIDRKTTNPWCDSCDLELQQMSFNGCEVLDMVVAMMPPTPPHPDATIKAYTVLRLSRQILIENELLLADDETDGGAAVPAKVLL